MFLDAPFHQERPLFVLRGLSVPLCCWPNDTACGLAITSEHDATTQSLLEVGLLTPENRFDDVADRVFALNGLTAEVLAITPDPTGFSLMGCSYV
jgi:hypothetical protein